LVVNNTVPFIKAQALGNDFVLVHQRDFNDHFQNTVKALADRRLGIGFDQLIVYDHPDKHQALVKFYNADGSQAEACGNGSRCLIAYLLKEAPFGSELELKTVERTLLGKKIDQETVQISMGEPNFDWQHIPQVSPDLQVLPSVPGMLCIPMAVNVGNPHVVFFVRDLESIFLRKLGPIIENHPLFPERVNVSFAQIHDPKRMSLSVWERGVGLTGACGTGACASAVVAMMVGAVDQEVLVIQEGGDLIIEWNPGESIYMTGKAHLVFEGKFWL
jgi:diaminopimelate epimerase